MTEKTSVIIVTRNREKMLAGCLESLVKQTLLPNEIIIVDNTSTDDTKKVALYFKKKLPIKYVLEKQVGIPFARNRGVKEASGSLLLMLDDDCVADKFWVERMVEAHKKYPKAWAIQGRTNSLPNERLFSLLAEFDTFCYLRNHAKRKQHLKMKNYFGEDFRDEIELLTCDTKNFSIKISYFKKHKLSFDEHFYRGEDTDLGRQIILKNGLIMFCSSIRIAHWERASLKEFLKQRWYMGRTASRIEYKWKTPSFASNTLWIKKLIALPYFCKVLNQWHNFPIFTVLLFLDRVYRLNGFFFEKRILTLEKQ
jgi:GT2 family glycosyltransferase